MRLGTLVFLALAGALARAEEGAATATPAEKVAALVSGLASVDPAELAKANDALERLALAAGRPGAEAERLGLGQALAGKLGSDVPVAARLWLLRQIEVIGRGEVVPALAKLLEPGSPPEIREAARRALESNPHVNAKRELRKALARADGLLKVGMIRSLGVRRDFLATGSLLEAAAEKDVEVKLAAIEALAAIGDTSAVTVCESALGELEGAERRRVERAFLRLADSLARNNERGAARRIYLRALGMETEARCAALWGISRTALQNEAGRLAAALADQDLEVRGAALAAAIAMPGEAIEKAVVARLEEASEARDRLACLRVLAERGASTAGAPLLAAIGSEPDPAARAECIRLLGKWAAARPDDAPAPEATARALVPLVGAGGEPGAAAATVLAELKGAAVTRTIAAALGETKDPAPRAVLLSILGLRGDPAAAEPIRRALDDASPAVRAAALEALARTGEPSTVARAIAALRKGETVEREAAERALIAIGGDEAGKAILAAASAETGDARARLFRVLGARREAAALPLLTEAARSAAEPAARLAAVEALGRLGDRSSLAALREAAKELSGAPLEEALRACVRIAREVEKDDRPLAASVYTQALGVLKDGDDLRNALRGLGETGGPEAVEKILPLAKEGPARREAGRAIGRICERLVEAKDPAAKEIYRLAAQGVEGPLLDRLARRLRRMGLEVEGPGGAGFVRRWWIVGPFASPGGALWEEKLPPEEGVDLAGEVKHGDETRRWKLHETDEEGGTVALENAGYAGEEVCAYLYAEVTVREARDALFKIGSDDHVACWLNGEKVHANAVQRGLTPEEDLVPVKLAAGANRILLKVINFGGGWGAALRITDREGKGVEFRERER